MRRHLFTAVLLLAFGMLAGCGQKGPLVLPPPNPAVATPSSAASTPKPAATAAPAAASSNG
ncbi:MAG: hypothetical protein OJF61_002858 [Rhodanobacteraceae bacterium]|jgi:predicted small lipoprotein YifL|nr:MAG: hypothetical protein OJF61_002858 [Rhodanobacteraceae bacterium]